MTDIKLDPEAVRDLIQGSILKALDDDAREELIKQALAYLMTPRKESWQNKPASPLDDAFRAAVNSAANKVVRDAVENDAKVQQAIKDLVSPTIVAICDGNYDGLPEAIGEAFGSWLQDRTRR